MLSFEDLLILGDFVKSWATNSSVLFSSQMLIFKTYEIDKMSRNEAPMRLTLILSSDNTEGVLLRFISSGHGVYKISTENKKFGDITLRKGNSKKGF
jgi:hypothetical protein